MYYNLLTSVGGSMLNKFWVLFVSFEIKTSVMAAEQNFKMLANWNKKENLQTWK